MNNCKAIVSILESLQTKMCEDLICLGQVNLFKANQVIDIIVLANNSKILVLANNSKILSKV